MINKEKDHFVSHLAIVNKTNTVRTVNDIYNQDGVLLVAKGTAITQDISQKIIRHRLLKPLETCISIDQCINMRELFNRICQLPDDNKTLRFPNKSSITSSLERACKMLAKHSLLIQKLTIMAHRLPELYEKSIICAYMALGIAVRMTLEESQQHTIFIAALLRDIGLLHIEPDVVQKTGALEDHEWRMLKSHSIIAKLFLDMVPGLSKRIGRTVIEHHERTDGSGYPSGKTGDKLCIEGQVVAMSDTLTAIYSKQVLERGYTLSAIIPVLQISSSLHFYQTYQAVIQIIKELSAPTSRVYSDEQALELARNVITRTEILKQWFGLALELTQSMQASLPDEKIKGLHVISTRLQQTITTSGLLTSSHIHWLNSVFEQAKPQDFDDIEHNALMLDELEWQCQQWEKVLASLTSMSTDTDELCSWTEKFAQLSALHPFSHVTSGEKILHTEEFQNA